LNNFEVEDRGHVKVNFKFLMGNFHFLLRSRKEQVDLTMTLKLTLDLCESPCFSRMGWSIIVTRLSYYDYNTYWS